MAEPTPPVVDYEKLETSRRRSCHPPKSRLSQKSTFPHWNHKGKRKSTIAKMCTWIVDRQISISATMLSALFLTHFLYPSSRPHTRKFFSISYYNQTTSTYALGWDDIFFVFYWIIVFTGLRCVFMTHILAPLGESLGLRKRKAKTRFVEQAWILIYYTLSFFTGMYVQYHSDYWLSLRALWQNWPVREMNGMSKWYYLVQFAFYLQQIVVVNIEERRKDHWQMFTHHIVTCALIFGSYGYHWTRVGTVIMCLMDVVDLFLPLAKILRYLKFQTACDATFGIFMVVWFIARHALYMLVCWSAYVHSPQEIKFGCYQGSMANLTGPTPVPDDWAHIIVPFQDPVGTICFNENVQFTFISLLLALQVILLMWFVMIVRVAYKVVTGQGADDVRSDDEESEEEEEEEEEDDITGDMMNGTRFDNKSGPLFEQEVLSTDAAFHTMQQKSRSATASRSPMGRTLRRKGDGHSSGVNLLAGSDRKELLGRIGCDKGADL